MTKREKIIEIAIVGGLGGALMAGCGWLGGVISYDLVGGVMLANGVYTLPAYDPWAGVLLGLSVTPIGLLVVAPLIWFEIPVGVQPYRGPPVCPPPPAPRS